MNFINLILLPLAFVSGLAAVTVQNQSREYFIALDKAQKQEIKLEQDFARLKLAQAGLASHQRIIAAAAKNRLKPPSAANTEIIETR